MSERETPQAIHDDAASWVARLDRSGDDAEARAAFEAWAAGDVRRRGAFLRAQAAWVMLDRASVLRDAQAREPMEQAEIAPKLSRRALLAGGVMAAGIAAMGIMVFPKGTQPLQITTALGEIRRVPLDDGSLATVNTETALAVSIEPGLRKVALDRGEAWFQVAKDRTRPFVVEAGEVRVKAVGTAFSVRRTIEGADVQVTEGVVEIWRMGDEANVRRIAAGQGGVVDERSGRPPLVADNPSKERSLSWRNGELIFDGDTVGEAAKEFNRYNAVKIDVSDPALADEKMIGRFRTNEPYAFAHAVVGLMDAHIEVRGDRIVLLR